MTEARSCLRIGHSAIPARLRHSGGPASSRRRPGSLQSISLRSRAIQLGRSPRSAFATMPAIRRVRVASCLARAIEASAIFFAAGGKASQVARAAGFASRAVVSSDARSPPTHRRRDRDSRPASCASRQVRRGGSVPRPPSCPSRSPSGQVSTQGEGGLPKIAHHVRSAGDVVQCGHDLFR